ncbi:arginine/ornithine antiporter ArcD [Halalkalicoccus jeotgali]|uniref:Na+/H+ antiporter NhaC n=1 Tax=Halalkalicoccus jeotgali (strain DSM 18796 / CECT 7217 / JCM 14584 / KCTC 4019 / B3) TaxID=795797 RepID=D8J8C2_HALJB|nr:Na+/H+ antiporter NhaC family protein [Halalkalicoccus jeotgali]ADJ16168.1 Na+/H+ antiporter NhaC [Halalkalicoccus jeotgali B3]ELY37597.1 Na+/H+ antiporter NhaC [Halalkalicoccus jeotgali B3]
MAELGNAARSYAEIPEEHRPSLGQALVPVVGMVVFLLVGSVGFGLDPHMPLLWGCVLIGLVGRYWLGYTWDDLFEGVSAGLSMGIQAILILFVIYMLIPVWIGAGTIPGLIYYGLGLLTPAVFLPATALIATVSAFSIGSSWTTAATLGVALMGIGQGLGVPAPMTAGAVLTGAYTGDKITPLSDTTNLAAAVTGTDLMEHVDTMRVGTGLALVIALVAYAVLGLRISGSIPAGQVETIRTGILAGYEISPLVFLPLLITFGLALAGYPALPALVAGVFAGVGTMLLVQGAGFAEAWSVAQAGTAPETGTALVDDLLASDGLNGSAWTVSIVAVALSLGGLLERTGVLAALANWIEEAIDSVAGLTVATGVSAFAMNGLAGQQYMSIVVPSMTFRGVYEEFGLESKNLSRAVEAAGTTTSVLIPWNAGGAFMTATLGVSPLAYGPYYFLGFLSPAILFVMGLTGWGISYRNDRSPGEEGPSPKRAPTDGD